MAIKKIHLNKKEIAKKLVEGFTENGISKYSKKKLAEIAVKRYPDLFKTVDDARLTIRRATGAAGWERLVEGSTGVKQGRCVRSRARDTTATGYTHAERCMMGS